MRSSQSLGEARSLPESPRRVQLRIFLSRWKCLGWGMTVPPRPGGS